MTHLRRRLLAVLSAAALAGSGAALSVAAPASAATLQQATLFDGSARNLVENVALAGAETAARRNALSHGFTDCSVFESVVSQDARTHLFFALVTVRCEDAAS
ncbi:hypothetical protein ACIBIZ_51885 [Nonomuraea spiralis]|uniref:hypothetical protein n=1 Tax=Nonomuraea TaxID=83681 RepID=UPI000F7AFAE9|nr:hypothetical protein [Nonomuraea sp. WAC 01424]RSM94465.1 hypothetical protein DMB42_51020 [Nonomuraea sp. WAC 01424]